jgi:hypothetical protein
VAPAACWSFWVWALHEFVGWFLGGIPLDHLPSANMTIDTVAVSNGQFGIAHEILRPAVPTEKVAARGECWGAHRCIIYPLAPAHASLSTSFHPSELQDLRDEGLAAKRRRLRSWLEFVHGVICLCTRKGGLLLRLIKTADL